MRSKIEINSQQFGEKALDPKNKALPNCFQAKEFMATNHNMM